MANHYYSGKAIGKVVAKAVRKGPFHETKFNRCDRIIVDARRLAQRQGSLQDRVERLESEIKSAKRAAESNHDLAYLGALGAAAVAVGGVAVLLAAPFVVGPAAIAAYAGGAAGLVSSAIGGLLSVRQALDAASSNAEARRIASRVDDIVRDLRRLERDWVSLWRRWESEGCHANEFSF